MKKRIKIALSGNPNSGKTTIFKSMVVTGAIAYIVRELLRKSPSRKNNQVCCGDFRYYRPSDAADDGKEGL